jgi:hypothetical protein
MPEEKKDETAKANIFTSAIINNGETISQARKPSTSSTYKLQTRENNNEKNNLPNLIEIRRNFNPHLCIGNYYVPSLLKNKDFSVKNIARETNGDKTQYKIYFRLNEIRGASISGWWIVLPQLAWSVQSLEILEEPKNVDFKSKRIIRGEVTYSGMFPDSIIPIPVAYKNTNNHTIEYVGSDFTKFNLEKHFGEKITHTNKSSNIEITKFAIQESGDEEFLLSSIGLGYAEQAPGPPKSNVGLYLVAIALISLFLGIYLKVRQLKQSRESAYH